MRAACGADTGLRREVESLLVPEEELESFIAGPLFGRRREPPEGLDGRRHIGPYRLLRLVGRGGMGVVYLAARADDELEQRVAIKLIRRGMGSAVVVARFRYERRILAGLEHPNIARLLDGGATSDGSPYFVMEYVEGSPIDRYCRAHRLALRERLELFLQVCDAVQLAHRNLVVHRDLKPANILVTTEGVPKLLDFGVAKLLAPGEPTPSTATVIGGPAMTPAYASPEQLQGHNVTTASDVYSLGVVLYKLLTGRLPFDDKETGRWPAPAASRQQEPPKPSTVARTEAGRLNRDLDDIVLKAMRHEAAERYPSVEQLSEDIHRFLNGRPVLASQGSWLYRTRKLIRRNGLRIAAAAALLLLAVSLTLVAIQGRHAKHERAAARQRIEREERVARRLGMLLEELMVASAPSRARGEILTARDVLDRSVGSVDRILGDHPLVQAALLSQMGTIYRRLGQLDRARNLLVESLRLRRGKLERDHPLVARSLNNLALVLYDNGEYRAAELHLREALAIYRQAHPSDEAKVAKVLNNLASSVLAQGDVESSIGLFGRSLTIRRRLFEGDDPRLARGLHGLARGLRDHGRFEEAEALYREALEMRRRLREPPHADLANSLFDLGELLRDRGDLEQAEPLLRQSLAMRRELYEAPDHLRIIQGLRGLAMLLQLRGDTAGAESIYREALTAQEQRWRADHPEAAATQRDLAALLTARGQPAAAEKLARRALEIFQAQLPPGRWQIADAESVLGGCLVDLGHHEEAEGLLRRGLPILRAVRGERARVTREARVRLRELSAAREQAADAS